MIDEKWLDQREREVHARLGLGVPELLISTIKQAELVKLARLGIWTRDVGIGALENVPHADLCGDSYGLCDCHVRDIRFALEKLPKQK